jgi:hypothetical protein
MHPIPFASDLVQLFRRTLGTILAQQVVVDTIVG